ncbi:MAG: hypothetical protein QHJ34_10260 [bacterium]|jgi:hypothetical protein|nr:hypothetical protein [candidate division KSB1 bacterium]MDH7560599.1 hypothetical protein [bacterium]
MNGVRWVGVVAVLSAAVGCAHWTAVSKEEVEPKQTVRLSLRSGTVVQGELVAADATNLIVQGDDGRAFRVATHDISSIERRPPVYDENGMPISEREIAAAKGHRQLFLHTFGGTALSCGVSFYLGSMLQRGFQEDQTDNTLRIATTAVGSAVGALYFALRGDKRDRQYAIQQINAERLRRSEEELNAERARKAQVEAELDRLRREQEAQEREIEALRKQREAQKQGKQKPPR